MILMINPEVHKDLLNIPFPKYNPKDDYCSCSPDRFFGINHNYACFLHDRQYRNEVKHRKTRKQSDIDLYVRIYCIYSKRGLGWLGYVISRVYYIGVRLFGGFAWL